MALELIEHIQWYASDYSGEDFVLVYFNQDLGRIEVYGEDSETGEETRRYDGVPRPEWDSTISGQKSFYKYCDGTTRIDFYYQETFPYYSIDRIPDGCSINVCDVNIVTPIRFNQESTVGAGDGVVWIKAVSQDGGIEYSLNGIDYQLSTKFTGLTAGNYKLYARLIDDVSCFDTVEFELRQPNVYGTRYTYTFNNDKGHSCVLTISERGYSGAVSVINWATNTPIIHQFGKKGQGKFNPIYSSTLTFNPFSETDFEWEQFQNADDFTYRVLITINGVDNFEGYILSQLHQEPFIGTPYPSVLTATDGIVLLKQFDFAYKDGSPIVGRISLSTAIQECISNLNLDNSSFIDCTDIVSQGMNTTRVEHSAGVLLNMTASKSSFNNLVLSITTGIDYTTSFPLNAIIDIENDDYGDINNVRVLSSTYEGGVFQIIVDYPFSQISGNSFRLTRQDEETSMLKQAYVDASIWEGMNCYEVLNSIMQGIGASFFQWETDWYVLPKRRIGNSIVPLEFDFNFDYTSTLSGISQNIAIDKSNNYWANQDATYKNLFAVQELRITQDYKTRADLMKSGKFYSEDFREDNTLKEWNGVGITFKRSNADEENYSIAIRGQQDSIEDATYLYSKTYPITGNNFDGYLEFALKYNVLSTDEVKEGLPPQVWIKVKATLLNATNIEQSSGVDIYLSNSGDWSSDEDFIILNADKFNEWADYRQVSRFFWNNAQFEVTLYQPIMRRDAGGNLHYDIQEVRYSDIKLEYLPQNDKVEKTRTFTFTNNTRSFKNKNEKFDVIIGDKNDNIQGASVMRGILYDINQTPTKNWYRIGVGEAWNLTELVGSVYLENHERPSKSITGTIKHKTGSYPSPLSWYTDPNLPNTKFMLNHWVYDIRNCAYKIEIIENLVLDTTQTTDNAYLLPNGRKIVLPSGNILVKEG